MKCQYHLCNNEITGKSKRFCHYNCKNKYYVDNRRRVLKEMAVAYKGGQCIKCGYSKCIRAMEFHHRDKKDKSFGISHPHTRSWEKMKIELEKCDLLCSNCHRESEHEELSYKYNMILE